MDELKKSSKCEIGKFKRNFRKKLNSKDGLRPHCKICRKIYRKKYYNEHYNLEIKRRRKYRFDKKQKN